MQTVGIGDTKARRNLVDWMARDPRARTKVAVGEALGITGPAVSNWCRGVSRPSEKHRAMIEKLSDGEVAAVDWLLPDERRALKRAVEIKPMIRNGTDG